MYYYKEEVMVMSVYKQRIKEKIEKARIDLLKLVNEKGTLIDPEVTHKSQELDKLLNQYNT
jgi:hypothetical protein